MMTKNEAPPSPAELKARAEDLIAAQSIMTLATASNNAAWAAPVYYVFHKSAFYFFSNPETKHIQDALASGQASVAIHVPSFNWQEICGMQMSGEIAPVSSNLAALAAIAAYLAKFPFTKDFFKLGQTIDKAAFEKQFRVKLYRFEPSLSYYLDNKIRFGFREEIDLSGKT